MSNFDPQPVQAQVVPPPKRGLSSGAKVAIVLCVVFGGMAIICCGLIGGVAYWGTKSLTNDPQVVAQKTAEMTTIDIPRALKPTAAIDLKVPISGKRLMLIVFYVHPRSNSTLILMTSGQTIDETNQQQMRQQMEQALQGQETGEREAMIVEETDQKVVTIDDTPVSFTIEKGKTASGAPRIRVTGVFPGELGSVLLLLEVDAGTVTEEDVERMLNSIGVRTAERNEE